MELKLEEGKEIFCRHCNRHAHIKYTNELGPVKNHRCSVCNAWLEHINEATNIYSLHPECFHYLPKFNYKKLKKEILK